MHADSITSAEMSLSLLIRGHSSHWQDGKLPGNSAEAVSQSELPGRTEVRRRREGTHHAEDIKTKSCGHKAADAAHSGGGRQTADANESKIRRIIGGTSDGLQISIIKMQRDE